MASSFVMYSETKASCSKTRLDSRYLTALSSPPPGLIMAASIVDCDHAAGLGDQDARCGDRRRIGQRGWGFVQKQYRREYASSAYKLPFVKSLSCVRSRLADSTTRRRYRGQSHFSPTRFRQTPIRRSHSAPGSVSFATFSLISPQPA